MEEMFDTYNDDGTPTGQIVARSTVHRSGVWHKTAHVWVYNSQREVLIQQRAACKDSHPLLWDISAAGHVPAGENVIDAALRECHEEIGATFLPSQFTHIDTLIQQFEFPDINFYDNEFVSLFLVQSNTPLSKYRAQESEVAELRFISLDALETAVQKRVAWLVPHWEEYEKVVSYIKS